MDGLECKTLLKMDDLGVPLFSETSIYMIYNYIHALPKIKIWPLKDGALETILPS